MTLLALEKQSTFIQARPFLKWAGGKSQLLDKLLKKVPDTFNHYIEPFVGGGALFFALKHPSSVIADLNPELINAYQCVAHSLEEVIQHLKEFKHSEKDFYRIRALKFHELDKEHAAARTIYLNRTCFNGLYRVNKNGAFNVPFGRYKNPKIYQMDNLYAASECLKKTTILCGDYQAILKQFAQSGDLIFLDPPYLPVSQYSDFKRYTKEQFYEEDHRKLAQEVDRLQKLGCYVISTHSNHPLVHELYSTHNIEVATTRRSINSKPSNRKGQDVIITSKPNPHSLIRSVSTPSEQPIRKYPPTRFMGSKEKLIPHLKELFNQFEFNSALDLFSGSGVVGYLLKTMGKQIYTNDYMAMSTNFARAMIENNDQRLTCEETERLFSFNPNADQFVQTTFAGLYYTEEENFLIDQVRANIKKIRGRHKRAIATSALIRACIKKRGRGIFTYTGLRYDDGRADLKKSLQAHIQDAIELINQAVFDNKQCNRAIMGDAMTLNMSPDLVYIDPPYYSPFSDNEYVRRYHFVEGLARDWKGVEIQHHTKTKKFKNYPTPFSSRSGSESAFNTLFHRMRNSILVVSYSSNSLPTREQLITLMSKYKSNVEVIDINHRYSFGNKSQNNRNTVKEYLFVGF